MCHGVGQDGRMINLTKASNVLCALFVLYGVCVCVCVYGTHAHTYTIHTSTHTCTCTN